jgi:hypothetical protein
MPGFLASPISPPLFRHTPPLDEQMPVRMPWRQAIGLLRLNDQTGAMEASLAKLADLRAQLDRAVADATRARFRNVPNVAPCMAGN